MASWRASKYWTISTQPVKSVRDWTANLPTAYCRRAVTHSGHGRWHPAPHTHPGHAVITLSRNPCATPYRRACSGWNYLIFGESPVAASSVRRMNFPSRAEFQQDRQCTYNVTWGRVRVTTVTVENK